MLTFRLLGPLEVLDGNEYLPLGGPKQRTLLALLVLNANRVISVGDLIDGLWADDPPARALETIQVYVSRLRKLFDGAEDDAPPRIEKVTGGYRLVVGVDRVDVFAFERLITLGRTALDAGHHREALTCFERALTLCRGTPGIDLSGERTRHETTRLEELRTSALEDRMEAELRLGRAKEVVAEIERLVGEHPYRERLRGQLMVALYLSGRQREALQAYQSARALLRDELGIDPGPDLQRLEAAILDQSLDYVGRADAVADLDDDQPTVPLTTSSLALGALVLPTGERHLLGGEPCTLGRSQSCTVPLDNPNLSRRHAVIRPIGEAFVLTDLGSTNGTRVNGASVAEHPLVDGDEIDVAGTLLVYEQRRGA